MSDGRWHTVKFVDETEPPHSSTSRSLRELWGKFRGTEVQIGKMYYRADCHGLPAPECDCDQFFVIRDGIGPNYEYGQVVMVCRRLLAMD